jgi:hypothetical protein
VRQTFRDGVFYISSIHDESLMQQLRRTLSDGLPETANASDKELQSILSERKILLIFDEPEIENEATFFTIKALAQHARVLIATRSRPGLERLRAKFYEIEVSRTGERRELLLRPYSLSVPSQTPSPDWSERLRSGQMSLSELFANTSLGKSMDEADEAAFRFGAAVAVTQNSPDMNSMDIFEGYLLTAKPGKGQSEQALAKAVLENFKLNSMGLPQAEYETLEMWRMFSRRPLDGVMKLASQSGSEIMNVRISSGLGKMLVRSVEVATEAGRPQPFSTRHLLACLLGPREWDLDPEGTDAIDRLDIHLPAVRSAFRDWMKQWRQEDNPAVMDEVLGLSDEQAKDPRRADATTAAYQRTYSAFIPDRAAYGHRATDAPLDDALGVGVHAGHLAQLIAAKETWMPLSIGLFGAWGAGKSHFIDLLDENLRTITRDPGKVFHKQIVQIRFNAWHYLDTNLWANLVCEIFDQLFVKLDERPDTTAAQVEKLKGELAKQSALAAEAKEALKTAEAVRVDAEEKLRTAMRERVAEEDKVGALLDDLKNLAINTEVRKQLRVAAEGLGLPKLQSSFAELEARAGELRSLGGREKALALAVFTGPGWWRRGLLLVVALAAPLGVAWLADHGTLSIQNLLSGMGRTIAQLVTTITALSAWISTQAKAGNSLVVKLESAYDEVKKVRAARESQDDAAKAQKALAAKRQAEEEARHTLREAEGKMKAIRAEIAELAPGRQLIRFLKERASAEDYKRHLGLVSLVRRDFEQLSSLLTKAGGQKDTTLPQIDRIVLYIDDLDRCRADRVIEVLEAVHLLLAFPLFAVVVAVDPRWLRQSLLDHYPRLLGGAEDSGNRLGGRALGRPATPQDYLEKIFQVPFNLQALEKTGYEALVHQLFHIDITAPKAAEPEQPAQVSLPANVLAKVEAPTVPKPTEIVGNPPESATSSQGGTVPIREAVTNQPKLQPPDPLRLALTKKEVMDVQRFQPLFQTPRAVKRLANTYCLIRVGVDEAVWIEYLGTGDVPGIYRLPMLLLAVTSAFPSLSRPWLIWLLEEPRTQWMLTKEEVVSLTTKHADTTDKVDWDRLAQSLNLLNLEGWPIPERDSLAKWVPRVARYSF